MFAKTIVTSDAFLDMPPSTRCLYFFLAMMADDDGFMNAPNSAIRQSGTTQDDMRLLIAKRFIIFFESGIVVIKHWKIHNYIRKDTYSETKYKKEKAALYLDEDDTYQLIEESPFRNSDEAVTGTLQVRDEAVTGTWTQDRVVKESKGKDSLVQGSRAEAPPSAPTIPTIDEIRAYISEHGLNVIAEKFFRYYEKNSWKTVKGTSVKWQDKLHEWSESENTQSQDRGESSFDIDQFFDAALAKSEQYYKELAARNGKQ